MKDIALYSMPRQTGKTTMAHGVAKTFASQDYKVYYFNHNKRMNEHCKEMYDYIDDENIIYVSGIEEFTNYARGTNDKPIVIILDEYFYIKFNRNHHIYNSLKNHPRVEKIYIYSTVDKMYNKEIVEEMRKMKKYMNHDFIESFTIKEKFKELWYNPLTDPDCNIYQMTLQFGDRGDSRFNYSSKVYNIEFKGDWLIKKEK